MRHSRSFASASFFKNGRRWRPMPLPQGERWHRPRGAMTKSSPSRSSPAPPPRYPHPRPLPALRCARGGGERESRARALSLPLRKGEGRSKPRSRSIAPVPARGLSPLAARGLLAPLPRERSEVRGGVGVGVAAGDGGCDRARRLNSIHPARPRFLHLAPLAGRGRILSQKRKIRVRGYSSPRVECVESAPTPTL